MTDRIQVKLNRHLHQDVKDFVDSKDSRYSSYKHFYEQAARELLKREQGKLTQEEVKSMNQISANIREDLKESIKEDLKEEMYEDMFGSEA